MELWCLVFKYLKVLRIYAKNLEGKELSAQGKAASDKEDKESAEAKAESKS